MVPTAAMGILGITSICCPAGKQTGIGRYSPQTSPFGLRLIFIWSCGDDLHNGSAPDRASKIASALVVEIRG
jgi:hypothetical protein